VKEIAPDIWQLRGFPPNFMNIYLAGDVLIDTATRHAAGRILRQLDGRELSLVALTHCHADHRGSAHEVCEKRGVPLACHEAEVDVMEGRRSMRDNMPELAFNRFLIRAQDGPSHKVDRVLHDGERVGDFTVIHAPGHSAGLVMFFRESDRVALIADVLFGINPITGLPGLHESPPMWTLDRDEARRSVQKLLGLQPSLVCFGHGPPLREPEKLERFASGDG
jgi:hydroxyacylglutathione hydrolase